MTQWGINIFKLYISFLANQGIIQMPFPTDMYNLIGFQQLGKNTAYSIVDSHSAKASANNQDNRLDVYKRQLLWGEMGDFVRSLTGRGESGKEEA